MPELTIPQEVFAGWHIVVVDDEPDSLFVLEHLLSHYGAIIHVAEDGSAGYALVREVKPRLVISDISMPRVDGWKMLKMIHEDVALAKTPVIALTAHAMRGDKERALEAGFNHYMTKPLAVETFIGDLLKLLKQVPSLADSLKGVTLE